MADETKERRLPYGIIWILFIVIMFIGGGLLLAESPRSQAVGLGLILSPVAAFGLLLLIYYLVSRYRA